MRRDDDLLRQILFDFESNSEWLFVFGGHMDMTPQERQREGHLLLLCDAGLLVEQGDSLFRLTSQGHDFLDAIRDDGIWKKTKAGAASVGGVSLGIMKEIAVTYLKQKISEKLGLNIA